jgi:hypothetical protein
MARQDDIIKSKLDLYDNAQDIFFDSLGATEQSILKSVLRLLGKVDTKDGKLENNLSSLALINELNKGIQEIIKDSTYRDKVSDYLVNFDTIENLNKELVELTNGIKLSKVNTTTIKRNAVNDLTSQLIDPKSINNNLATPIKDIMFRSITTGATLKEARDLLSTFIAGDETKLGSARRWVSQIARDSLTQYDGLVNDIIAKEYELPAEISWAKSGFGGGSLTPSASNKKGATGMNPITTVETFATYRGGFNCRHMAIPVRIEDNE